MLTKNAVATAIATNELPPAAVLQIISFKTMAQAASGQERYRLCVSDGSQTIQALTSMGLNAVSSELPAAAATAAPPLHTADPVPAFFKLS